jgi:hypothetical protein
MGDWSFVSLAHHGHGFTLFGNPFAFSSLDIINPPKDLVHSLEGHALCLREDEIYRDL